MLAWPAAGAELQFNFGDLAANGSLTNFYAALLAAGPGGMEDLPDEVPSAFAPLTDQAQNVAGAQRAGANQPGPDG